MSYSKKKVALTGSTGFLGDAIFKRLLHNGADVKVLHGDIRDPKTFSEIDYTYDYLFHFASPSSQILFRRHAWYSIETTVKGFMNAADVCRSAGVKLVYPSTGLLSSPAEHWNEYARTKKMCEDLHVRSGLNALGLRIFATYGPSESHKRDYASVPYLFAKSLCSGKSPVIFGNGMQMRDFIYIDDVVNAVLTLAEECNEKIVDVGSGQRTTFNWLFSEINEIVRAGLHPEFIDKPAGYISETCADTTVMSQYITNESTDLSAGLRRVVEAIRG